MRFWEAMKVLEEGKKVRKLEWEEDSYIYLKDDIIFWHDDEPFFTSEIDFENKWEIYKEKKEIIDEKFKRLYHLVKDEQAYLNRQYEDFITEHKLEDHLTFFYRQLLEMNKYYKLDK